MSELQKLYQKLCALPVSSGRSGRGRNLPTREDYVRALREIWRDDASPALIGAFLTAQNRLRLQPEALVGGVEVLFEMAKGLPPAAEKLSSEIVDTCGTGGDGQNTFNISSAAALVAAGAGVKIAKHGNRSASSLSGSADCFEALGIKIDMPAEKSARALNEVGFAFLFAPFYHVGLQKVAAIRKALGVRTLFNLLGPLANPFRPKRQVLGVADENLQEPMALALRDLGALHAWIVHSEDGLDEISLSAPTSVLELKEENLTRFVIDPRQYGFNFLPKEALRGGDAHENARLIEDLLHGRLQDSPQEKVVLLNAAAAIMVSGQSTDFKEALQIAADSLTSGAAVKVLERLRTFS